MPNQMPPARRGASSPGAPSGDRPRVSRGSAPARRRGAKLICTAGPKAGEEYDLAGDEVVIGRATENQVSISDTSVSRKHVLLRQVDGGWAASDMGSGNGTLVNGEPIAEETVLKAGDTITIGDTELSFDDGGGGGGGARPGSTQDLDD